MAIIRYADVLARPIGEGVDLDTTILDWIQQQIEVTNDGIIRVKIVDLRKVLGPKVLGPNCEEKTDSNIYMGLRNALKK